VGALLSRGDDALWADDLPRLGGCDHELAPPHLSRPLERLVRAAHLLFPERADWLLRARILSAAPLNASGWGLVKVGAKRHSTLSHEELLTERDALARRGLHIHSAPLPVAARVERLQLAPFVDELEAARWLLTRTTRHNEALRALGGGQESPLMAHQPELRRWRGAQRAVGALLLDAELRPWALAFKQPERHPLYHAEWALLDALLRSGLSLDLPLTLLSTLKPCKLCAGAWVSYGPSALRVRYLSDDLGKMGQNTAFDLGSFAWREAGEATLGNEQSRLIL